MTGSDGHYESWRITVALSLIAQALVMSQQSFHLHMPPHLHGAVGHEPRWPSVVAGLSVGGLYLALPRNLNIGPQWLLLVIVCILQTAGWIAFRRQDFEMAQRIGHALSGVLTLSMLISLGLLVHALPTHKEGPAVLLRSAVCLWITNVIVFASWYWRLDGGGPHKRALRCAHTDGAFLFPQMTLDNQQMGELCERGWSPRFVDYLFIAFNTSTALSPTDTAVLSKWAKVLMMIQTLISLTVMVLLAARAVNIM